MRGGLNRCFFCKEPIPPFHSHLQVIEWNEVHSPYWAPAHRKCTDACEREATSVLSKWYEDQPEGDNRVHGYYPED